MMVHWPEARKIRIAQLEAELLSEQNKLKKELDFEATPISEHANRWHVMYQEIMRYPMPHKSKMVEGPDARDTPLGRNPDWKRVLVQPEARRRAVDEIDDFEIKLKCAGLLRAVDLECLGRFGVGPLARLAAEDALRRGLNVGYSW